MGDPAEARRPRAKKKVRPVATARQGAATTTTLEDATARMQDPATWCSGARALERFPAEQSLPPLLMAYGRDGGDKSCLRRSLARLSSRETAWKLYDTGGMGRVNGLLLMQALPDDQHLPRIMQAILDQDPQVRLQARRALFAQNPTAAWDVVVLPLLDAEDQQLRGMTIESVARHPSDQRADALRARLPKERDAKLKDLLEKTIRAL